MKYFFLLDFYIQLSCDFCMRYCCPELTLTILKQIWKLGLYIFQQFLRRIFFCELPLNSYIFQLKIIAYDSKNPDIKGTSNIQITVRRNVNAPTFIGLPYSKSVSELYPMGDMIINVTAVDADKVSYCDPLLYLHHISHYIRFVCVLCIVSGVSGSGKSILWLEDTLLFLRKFLC